MKTEEGNKLVKPDSIAYPPRGMNREEAARYVGVGSTTFDRPQWVVLCEDSRRAERGLDDTPGLCWHRWRWCFGADTPNVLPASPPAGR